MSHDQKAILILTGLMLSAFLPMRGATLLIQTVGHRGLVPLALALIVGLISLAWAGFVLYAVIRALIS